MHHCYGWQHVERNTEVFALGGSVTLKFSNMIFCFQFLKEFTTRNSNGTWYHLHMYGGIASLESPSLETALHLLLLRVLEDLFELTRRECPDIWVRIGDRDICLNKQQKLHNREINSPRDDRGDYEWWGQLSNSKRRATNSIPLGEKLLRARNLLAYHWDVWWRWIWVASWLVVHAQVQDKLPWRQYSSYQD